MRHTTVRMVAALLVLAGLLVMAPASEAHLLQQSTNTFTGTATSASGLTFSATSSLHDGHGSHTATLLQDGRVLFVGGFRYHYDGESNASAELYDPATGNFTLTGSLHQARSYHTATLLANGKVLIVGGEHCCGLAGILGTAELYDPATGTFAVTGNLGQTREYHRATLLPNGKVLISGGYGDVGGYGNALTSEELYDPAQGTFSPTGSLGEARLGHTATLLTNGKVLIVGGDLFGQYNCKSAELYDPASGTSAPLPSPRQPRLNTTATLLLNGQVFLAAGDRSPDSAELFDPVAGTFSSAASLQKPRSRQAATLLVDGRVLLVGGSAGPDAELYDPTTNTFALTGSLREAFQDTPTATLLGDGRVLVAAGYNANNDTLTTADLGVFAPGNTFTGSLTLPAGWIATRTATVTFRGSAAEATLSAGALSNDRRTWGAWQPAATNEPVTSAWDFEVDGANKPVYLHLRDTNGSSATVVTGTVNVDTTAPASTMSSLPGMSQGTFSVAWSGTDGLSGVDSYDVDVRAGTSGAWTRLRTATRELSTTFTAESDTTYYFRVRATDVAGNVEPWPATYDASTLVDSTSPEGTIIINSGALATAAPAVTLSLSAEDVGSGATHVRLGPNGVSWGAWQTIAPTVGYTLPAVNGLKPVYAQFEDAAGNVSDPVSDTIRLAMLAGTDRLVSINSGALWTRITAVTLRIGAPAGTTQMQLSNDGGFDDASWQPFDTRPNWTLTVYGAYTLPRIVYVRVRGADGVSSAAYSDDIIYDPVAPVGQESITSATNSTLAVKLSASDPDNLSGVRSMRVGVSGTQFSQARWEPYATAKTVTLSSPPTASIFVCTQYLDGAGNASKSHCVATAPAVTSNLAQLSFGTLGLRITNVRGVKLTNSGSAPLTVYGMSLTGANPSDFAVYNTTCMSTLAVGANCTVNVSFTPHAVGVRGATLTISDNTVAKVHRVPLTGTGTTASLSHNSILFSSQAVGTVSVTRTETLKNAGTTRLTISKISLSGAQASDFRSSNTCGSGLAAGASCTISVTFRPTATGTRAALLSVADNAIGSPHTISLLGTGTAP